jgi:hypothetical protein
MLEIKDAFGTPPLPETTLCGSYVEKTIQTAGGLNLGPYIGNEPSVEGNC